MLLDASFLIDLSREFEARQVGSARHWLAAHRHMRHWTTVVCVGELAAGMPANSLARVFLAKFHIARLQVEIAYETADIDRELIGTGQRLGENDNWIAGFARYYGEPIVSNDVAFDRVRGIRRVAY